MGCYRGDIGCYRDSWLLLWRYQVISAAIIAISGTIGRYRGDNGRHCRDIG